MLRYNRYRWSTVFSYVGNSAGRCGGRNRTGKMKCTEGKNCISITDLIKGRCIIFCGTTIRWKRTVEEILSKSFQEFSDNNQFFIVISPNPITKQFPTSINSHPHRKCSTQPHPTTLSNPELLQYQIRLPWFFLGVNLINIIFFDIKGGWATG